MAVGVAVVGARFAATGRCAGIGPEDGEGAGDMDGGEGEGI